MFNRRHIGITGLRLEYEKKVQNMSVLTVGARALSKHAHRSTEVSMDLNLRDFGEKCQGVRCTGTRRQMR